MELAIFPTGTAEGTYHFVMVDNTLTCSFGTRRNDNITTRGFLLRVYNTESVDIAAKEQERLIDLLNELHSSKDDIPKKIYLGGWDVSLLYNGKVYEANYWDNESRTLQKIVDEIIRLSPVTVDIHGFS